MNVHTRLFVIFLALVLGGIAAAGSLDQIDVADDWETEASAARKAGIPLMVVFSTHDCTYCVRLKNQVLAPLVKSGKLPNKVLVREFKIDRGGKIVDFDGERVRARIFVKRYDIYATPTVLFVDYKGEPLASPIVGYNEPHAYTELLSENIDNATMTLAALRSPFFTAVHLTRDQIHHQ